MTKTLFAATFVGVAALLACHAGDGPPPLERDLLTAARRGDVRGIERALAAGVDAGAAESAYGRTSLMRAAAFGHPDAVSSLLSAGADVNARDNAGATAVHLAAAEGESEAIRRLAAAGADLAIEGGSSPRTPLGAAVDAYVAAGSREERAGRKAAILEAISVLLDSGAGPDGAGGTADSPLNSAIQYGEAALVRVLLEKGADPNLASLRSGASPLVAAASYCYRSSPEIFAALLEDGADSAKSDARDLLTRWIRSGGGGDECRSRREAMLQRLGGVP